MCRLPSGNNHVDPNAVHTSALILVAVSLAKLLDALVLL